MSWMSADCCAREAAKRFADGLPGYSAALVPIATVAGGCSQGRVPDVSVKVRGSAADSLPGSRHSTHRVTPIPLPEPGYLPGPEGPRMWYCE